MKNEIIPGQYDVFEKKFFYRYLVFKVMKKTADVTVLTSYMGGDHKGGRCYRYPLELLKKQVEKAYYTNTINPKPIQQ